MIAGLTKSVVSLVDDGALAILTSWEIYALAVTATGAILLQQSAFQSGDLDASASCGDRGRTPRCRCARHHRAAGTGASRRPGVAADRGARDSDGVRDDGARPVGCPAGVGSRTVTGVQTAVGCTGRSPVDRVVQYLLFTVKRVPTSPAAGEDTHPRTPPCSVRDATSAGGRSDEERVGYPRTMACPTTNGRRAGTRRDRADLHHSEQPADRDSGALIPVVTMPLWAALAGMLIVGAAIGYTLNWRRR